MLERIDVRHQSRHTFKGLLRRAARDAGLPEEKASKLTAYDFRHSRATHWVENSRNLAGVAFLLGHKEITTLNKYVKPGQRGWTAAVVR